MKKILNRTITVQDINQIIDLAFNQNNSFESIAIKYGITEKEVAKLLKIKMKLNSWKMWRVLVNGVKSTKKQPFHCWRESSLAINA